MSSGSAKEILLDVRGQVCPATLLLAMARLNQHRREIVENGAFLYIMSDNRNATATIPETAANMGYQVKVKQETGYYSITIWWEDEEDRTLP